MAAFRFQTKLTIVYIALFLAIMGIILFAFYRSVTSNVQLQTLNQLSASARIFEQVVTYRVETLGDSAEALAQDYGFRQAIATRDQPTVQSSLQNYIRRLEADVGAVIDIDGELVSAIVDGTPVPDTLPIGAELQAEAEEKGVATSLVAYNGRVYELVLTQVRAPVPVAWLAFGIELDAEAALEIKNLSAIDLEIAFIISQNGRDWNVTAATSQSVALSDFMNSHHMASKREFVHFTEHDYLFWRLPLGTEEAGEEIAALLYYSLDTALAPYKPLVVTMVVVLAASLLLLIVGSLLVARGVTRPLRRLATAAQSIATGDYADEVPCHSEGDEVADLTNSFNSMVGAVQERERRITYQAFHDTETNLPNRLMFEGWVSEAAEKVPSFALFMVEIQQMQELRTVLNHQNINDLMISVAERVAQVSDTRVARISTEAFAFIISDAEEAETVASLVTNSFMTPFEVADIVLDAGVKMGIVKYPGDGEDAGTLLRHAQGALDKARSLPGSFAWYDPEREISQKQRLSMMSELRVGLVNGEVRFAYQPKLDLKSGKVTAVEALIRWISPTRGFVPPDEFIPLAEKTGDVHHVTEWALKTAVAQAADWREKGLDLAVAVNLSTNDLLNRELPGRLLRLLKEYSLPPMLLKLEVTESAIMHDMARALEVLDMLSAMGIALSIDDYGTGYSSLSYIKKLPVGEIKIDKSFVLNLAKSEEDNILVRSTIDLGHNLGLSVTAEGVEDAETVERLRDYGCDVLQGYHISRPVPAEELEAFLKESEYG